MDEYNKYLEQKNQSNIWKKAKQREFNSLDQIILAIGNLNSLTWRNAMTLRLLGLIGKPSEGSSLEVGLTAAGKTLLNSAKKQQILDEQLLKLYLNSNVNSNLNIDVFPTVIVCTLLAELGSLSFDEYALFVCWINEAKDVEIALSLIVQYRAATESDRVLFREILNNKTNSLGYSDFNDNIYRLFAVFKLLSFINSETPEGRWSDVLRANSGKDIYQSLIESIEGSEFDDYEQYDTKFLGIIKVTPEYSDITEEMSTLTPDEQKLIKQQIIERNKLPDIALTEPRQITADFLKILPKKTPSSSRVSSKAKIDYEKRDKRNRLVGAYGERVVMKYEYNKLVAAGKSDLAAKIEHSSLVDDSLGYDIKSYTIAGEERHIEVKTVSGKPKNVRFFVSKNELDKVENDPYHCIFIVLNYDTTTPEILEVGNLAENIKSQTAELTPVNFTVVINLEYTLSTD